MAGAPRSGFQTYVLPLTPLYLIRSLISLSPGDLVNRGTVSQRSQGCSKVRLKNDSVGKVLPLRAKPLPHTCSILLPHKPDAAAYVGTLTLKARGSEMQAILSYAVSLWPDWTNMRP